MRRMSQPHETQRDQTETSGPVPPNGSAFGSTDLLLLLMTVIWGSNFTTIKYSLEDLLPLSFNALRFTLASLVMLIIVFATKHSFKVERGDGRRLFLLGLLGN